jgi:quercetin dioxygenase-like cupin family protein
VVTGADTAGRYTTIDMHVPHGGGPAPHRHDFEEMFTVLEVEVEATFRGQKRTVRSACAACHAAAHRVPPGIPVR